MKLLAIFSLLVLIQCTNGLFLKGLYNKVFGNKKVEQCKIPAKCDVKLIAFERNDECLLQRKKEIGMGRYWYQITDGKSPRGTEFPLTEIPWLNQTLLNTAGFYAMDDFEAGYLATLQIWLKISEKIDEAINRVYKNLPYESVPEFVGLNQAFNKALRQQNPRIIGNPTIHGDFTDHITNSQWRTDEAFAQRRLAGQCPFTLRKVVRDGKNGITFSELNKVMNPEIKEFEFNIGFDSIDFNEAVNQGRLFVQRYEDMDYVTTQLPDKTPRDGRQMMKMTSPISYFILLDKTSGGLLTPVAIQIDSTKSAKVIKPSDGDEWQIAKVVADSMHDSWCQSYVHLGEVHFVNTIYCLSFRRHLSEKHPLYDFFKFHCEGTVVHISTTYTVLASANSSGDIFFAMGNKGFIKLASKAYAERKYEKFSYENMIEGRGLDDERIQYYPFRDDAKVILHEYKSFARSLTKAYYGLGPIDFTRFDVELKNWVEELSQGVGKMPGFPSSISNRESLQEFIVNFLWINVLHSTCNYALAPDFVPTSSPKLYKAAPNTPALTPNQIFMNGDGASGFTLGRGKLCNFRVNRIFDYYEKVKDEKFGELVRKSFHRMNGCVQKKLRERNAERKRNGRLGYQFLEPQWLTNSIHI